MIVLTRRLATSGILLLWGVVLTYFYFSGRVQSYLHPNFHLAMVICGLVLILMAVAMLAVSAEDDCGDPHCAGALNCRPISWKNGVAWFILVVPLLVAVKVSPSQFGATTVLNRGLIQDAAGLPFASPLVGPAVEPALPGEEDSLALSPAMDSSTYLVKNAKGQIKVEAIDLLFAAEEEGLRVDFENKEVEIIGQFLPAQSNNPNGDRFNLVRMYMTCCAADARPISVTVQMAQPPKVKDMTWLRIEGKATFPLEGGRRFPLIVADSAEECDAPPDAVTY